MNFQVGEKVVHWSFGPGEIIRLDEKELAGRRELYYVVRMRDLTIWVPVEAQDKPSLRAITPAEKFKQLFSILSSPAEPLSLDRLERKNYLTEMLRDGDPASICRVIRDLATFTRGKKKNESDLQLLERAQKFLIDEWRIALSVTHSEAEAQLRHLLKESLAKTTISSAQQEVHQ